MTKYVFANNASTTLGSSLGSAANTLTVATGTGQKFPSPTGGEVLPLTLIYSGSSTGTPNEIVYATARVGDTFTILRGQEGTNPAPWAVGDTVADMATAGFYNQQATVTDIQSQGGNSGQDTGAANSGIVTLNPAPASIDALNGVPIRIGKMNTSNTGAYVLNVNNFGNRNVLLGGRALENGQLPGAQIFEVVYDGTSFELISNPAFITNSGMSPMPMNTVKGNLANTTTTPQDIPLSSLASHFDGLGQDQSWQDVTAQRAGNQNYVNNTGKPIFVAVNSSVNINSTYRMFVDGVMVQQYITGVAYVNTLYFTTVVPPGSTYSTTFTPTLGSWVELR